MNKYIAWFIFLILLIVFSTILKPFILIVQAFRQDAFLNFAYLTLLAEDQSFSNYVYGKRGQDFYISSVAEYDARKNKNAWFRDFINFIFRDKEHCKKSYESDIRTLGFFPELDKDGEFIKVKRSNDVTN